MGAGMQQRTDADTSTTRAPQQDKRGDVGVCGRVRPGMDARGPSFPRLTISRLHLISFGNGSNARAARTFTGCNQKGHRTLAGKTHGSSKVRVTKRGVTGPVERKGAPHRLRNTVRAGTTIDAPSLTHPTHQLASSSSIK